MAFILPNTNRIARETLELKNPVQSMFCLTQQTSAVYPCPSHEAHEQYLYNLEENSGNFGKHKSM